MNSNFVKYQIIDQQQGLAAGNFEHPAEWQAGSNVFWNYQNSNSPVSINAWAINPNKFEMFAFLPMQSFSWTEPDQGIYFRGQNVGGLINLPPMPPEDAVKHCLIPTYCGNKENLKIIGVNIEPINRPIDPRFQSMFFHQIMFRVEYTENGLQIEEEFQCVHQVAQFPPMPGFFGATQMTGWNLLEICSFRTEKGKLDGIRETFLRIKSSLQIDQQWQQSIQQVAQMLLQNSKQQGDAIINQGWANLQNNQQRMNETAARNQAYINQQQRRIDAMPTSPPPPMNSNYSSSSGSEYSSSDAFVDAMREENSIYNSENTANEKVSIHGGDYIYKNERGDVQTTNDPNYDPNIGSNWNWVEAQKKKIGD